MMIGNWLWVIGRRVEHGSVGAVSRWEDGELHLQLVWFPREQLGWHARHMPRLYFI
ncbi:MAG: hypothetical protein F6K46_06645 [Moorea sp. SIO3E8]|nr:hypothetical protein [Moorena sp. SIO3E8]